MIGPRYGICPNANVVSCPPLSIESALIPGFFMIVVTSTSPVIRHTTTVSQNVPVEDTSAWRTGFLVCAAAAAIGAEPRPDSLENRPLATPYWIAIRIPLPTRPPAAAPGANASLQITRSAGIM